MGSDHLAAGHVTIIGGGLAGCEAAWQAARRHCRVHLHEMRPHAVSPAHTTDLLAELVCSNSFRSDAKDSAIGLLKEEMRQLSSLVMEVAAETKVPAGKALAVDRHEFAGLVTRRIEEHPLIIVSRQEIKAIPGPDPNRGPVIIASGPLTSAPLAAAIQAITGQDHLAFYDAIAPIVFADSVDRTIVFQASRYDDGPGDYLNCPMDKEQYQAFIAALAEGQKVALRPFEEKKYFEGCLPIEVMLERGEDTLRFGPLKPVGLPDPKTGQEPYAVVQLRKENKAGTLYNMVGFQTKLAYGEQTRIFRLIPGLARAEFARLGSVHRNTFVCAPVVLEPTLQFKQRPDLFLAGQITGVEGYIESSAMGLLAGINAARSLQGKELIVPPPETALGALIGHLTQASPRHFQPSNINFGLFAPLGKKLAKKLRGREYSQRALQVLGHWTQDRLEDEHGC